MKPVSDTGYSAQPLPLPPSSDSTATTPGASSAIEALPAHARRLHADNAPHPQLRDIQQTSPNSSRVQTGLDDALINSQIGLNDALIKLQIMATRYNKARENLTNFIGEATAQTVLAVVEQRAPAEKPEVDVLRRKQMSELSDNLRHCEQALKQAKAACDALDEKELVDIQRQINLSLEEVQRRVAGHQASGNVGDKV